MFKTELFHDIRDFDSRNLLDVREKDEFASGHIPKAQNLPLSELKHSQLDVEKEYTLICHSGSRSHQAALILSAKGYRVIAIMGGMANYKGVLDYEL